MSPAEVAPKKLSNSFEVYDWVDADGVTQGMISHCGDRWQPLPGGNIHYGGPANTYVYKVDAIFVSGNYAEVWGTVIACPDRGIIGGIGVFQFTDNVKTGDPDLMGYLPIDAGNYIVRP